jgi:hypothetical protein
LQSDGFTVVRFAGLNDFATSHCYGDSQIRG